MISMIIHTYLFDMKKSQKSSFCHQKDFCGTTIVGERGQVVIPKIVRDRLKIKSGNSFLVMEKEGAIILVSTDKVKKMLTIITKHLEKIK